MICRVRSIYLFVVPSLAIFSSSKIIQQWVRAVAGFTLSGLFRGGRASNLFSCLRFGVAGVDSLNVDALMLLSCCDVCVR